MMIMIIIIVIMMREPRLRGSAPPPPLSRHSPRRWWPGPVTGFQMRSGHFVLNFFLQQGHKVPHVLQCLSQIRMFCHRCHTVVPQVPYICTTATIYFAVNILGTCGTSVMTLSLSLSHLYASLRLVPTHLRLFLSRSISVAFSLSLSPSLSLSLSISACV